MQQLEAYVRGKTDAPFVVHGKSGCGKTSLMAVTARKAWAWLQEKPVIILRSAEEVSG